MARILIVDAEQVRVQRLRGAKHEVRHVRDPAEIKKLAGEAFAVAVVAIRDPLLRYLELVRLLKSDRNDLAKASI